MASDIEHQSPTQDNEDISTHVGLRHHLVPLSRFCYFLRSIGFELFRLLVILRLIIFVVLVIAFCPLAPLFLMVVLNLPISNLYLDEASVSNSPEGMTGIYQKSRRTDTTFIRVRMGSFRLLARSGLLLVVWLALNFFVIRFRRLTFLGSPLWRWSLLALTLTAAYFVAMSVYILFPLFYSIKLAFTPPRLRKYPFGYFYSSLMFSVVNVTYFGMVLVSWLSYFRTDHGLNNPSTPHPHAFEYVTWTCVSLFVGSILCLLKTLVLCKWSVNAIYRRFEPRILITEAKFLYLGVIVGAFLHEQCIEELMEIVEGFQPEWEGANFSYTKYIMQRISSITHVDQVGTYLTYLATNVRPLEEDGVPDLIELFQRKITASDQKCELRHLLELLHCTNNPELFMSAEHRNKAAFVLFGLVREECSSDDEFTFDDLKKWMVDAHKNCVNMGRTLADANAIVTRLDRFISFVISIAVVLLWFLITGIATTTVLVAIAPPFLALTFIFGDSAKTFFQGIIFCFVTHPFDVGDRCILDQTELEVKSIGIWTTTFIKIGTTENQMYPNLLLATKAIVNLGWQPDPTDVVELTLHLSTSPTVVQMLEDNIEKFFSDPRQKGSFEKSHEVMMKEIGDKIKVTIHFKHVLNIKEVTHSQCLQKKNKQRSVFLKKLNQIRAQIMSLDD